MKEAFAAARRSGSPTEGEEGNICLCVWPTVFIHSNSETTGNTTLPDLHSSSVPWFKSRWSKTAEVQTVNELRLAAVVMPEPEPDNRDQALPGLPSWRRSEPPH